jgi:hypothetical protein
MEEREGDGREYGQQGLAGWEMTVMDGLTKRLAAHVRQPGAFAWSRSLQPPPPGWVGWAPGEP